MSVRGGRVNIIADNTLRCDSGYPPKMYLKIEVVANFPEEMEEIVKIIHKRLIEAQTKINLEICGIMEADE